MTPYVIWQPTLHWWEKRTHKWKALDVVQCLGELWRSTWNVYTQNKLERAKLIHLQWSHTHADCTQALGRRRKAAVYSVVVASDVRTQTQARKTTKRHLEGQQISLGFYPCEITTIFQSTIVTAVNKTVTFFPLFARYLNIYNFSFAWFARAVIECGFVYKHTRVGFLFEISEAIPPKLLHYHYC